MMTIMMMRTSNNRPPPPPTPPIIILALDDKPSTISNDYNEYDHLKGAVSRNSAKLGNYKMLVKLR